MSIFCPCGAADVSVKWGWVLGGLTSLSYQGLGYFRGVLHWDGTALELFTGLSGGFRLNWIGSLRGVCWLGVLPYR